MRSVTPTLLGGALCATLLWIAGAPAKNHLLPPPAIPTTEIERGVLLIASHNLRDPNFAQTVVLITEHGVTGSVGLVLNRPTVVAVADVLPNVDQLQGHTDMLLVGGPVEVRSMCVLVQADGALEGGTQIMDGVHFVNEVAVLERLLSGNIEHQRANYYAGYAGWRSGQLNAEVARGDWHLTRGTSDVVFRTEAPRLWPQLIQLFSGQWVEQKSEANAQAHLSQATLFAKPRNRVCRRGSRFQQRPTLNPRQLHIIP